MKKLSAARAKRMQIAVMAGFFSQAVVAITYIPRIPELIDQLGVSFAEWGLIIGLSGIGSLLRSRHPWSCA